MSVRLNLLPDLRQAKLKEQSRRRLAITSSIAICSAVAGVVLLLALWNGGQKVLISTTSKSINDRQTQLSNMDGLLDALTAQAHAASLPDLYAKRVYYSHFFKAYSESSPAKISISNLTIDSSNLLKATGTSDSYASVAKLARALEADNIKIGTNAAEANQPYFSSINIDTVARDDTGVAFTLSATVEEGATSNGSN